MRTAIAMVTACVSIFGLSLSGDAAAAIRKPTHIPEQELGSALREFAAQRELRVMFVSDDVKNLRAPAISGDLTPDEILRLLLEGTGLTYRFIDQETISILPADMAKPVAESSARSVVVAEQSAKASQDIAKSIEEIVITGTRFNDRTPLNSPVPVDVVTSESLRAGGRTELGESLAAAVPSLNFQAAAPASSASAMRPITLRGLPANQVLVLVNGKRWHPTSVYGTGMIAFDFNSLPPTSVESIDVLRDGASAQYGSDAIAGVVNLRLREDTRTELSVTSGQYFAGDGLTLEAAADTGARIGDDGFVHVSAYFRDSENTNRQGRDVRQQYFAFDPAGNPVVLGTTSASDATPVLPPGYSFDPREFSGVDRLKNYNLGNAERREAAFNFNSELAFENGVSLYGFGGYAQRKTDTVFLWRQPLNNGNVRAIFPDGFAPLYRAEVSDAQLAAGVRGTAAGWNWDLSESWGFNRLENYAENTVNASLGTASPTSFFSGLQRTEQATTNLDINRELDIGWRAPLRVAVGAEYRRESIEVTAGEPASYINGGIPILDGPFAGTPAPIGASGIGGYTPSDAVDTSRDSIAAYLDLENQITDRLLVTLAGRYEHYSDFGTTTNGKVSLRHELNPYIALRGSVSSGFRAPSLYESYFSNTGSAVIGGEFFINRNFPVADPVARALGATPLEPEKSVNYSLGSVITVNDWLSFTIDAYRIDVRDAIIQSSFFTGASVREFLAARGFTGINSAQFFTNAVDKRVQGIDVTGNLTATFSDGSRLILASGLNFNDPEVTSIDPTPPELAAVTTTPLFNAQSVVTVEEGAPRSRINVSATYRRGPLEILLRETRYGSTRALGNTPPASDQTFGAKWITDLDISYQLTDAVRLTVGGQNLFDVYPDENAPINNPAGLFTNSFGFNAPFGLSGGYYYLRALVHF